MTGTGTVVDTAVGTAGDVPVCPGVDLDLSRSRGREDKEAAAASK